MASKKVKAKRKWTRKAVVAAITDDTPKKRRRRRKKRAKKIVEVPQEKLLEGVLIQRTGDVAGRMSVAVLAAVKEADIGPSAIVVMERLIHEGSVAEYSITINR